MATLIEVGCDDGVCKVDLDVACGNVVGGGDLLCEIFGESGEVIGDDRRSFQNGERIVECSKLGTNCVVTEFAIVNVHIGVINGEIGEVVVNETEQPLETEATDDPIVTVSAVSQFVEDCVDETQPNIQQKGSAESIKVSEHKDGTEIEICDDDGEQTQFEVTFPASFVRLDINIQFGSFGDTKSALKVSNPETESECGANINNHEPILIDLQEHDKNVTCEGVDDIDDGQGDGQRVGFLINVQTEEDEDERLDEQIKNAQLQLDEKRRRREAIKDDMHIKFGSMIVHKEAFKAKNLKFKAAMQLVKSKREQIDQVQSVMNKVKNAIAVEDIDSRVHKAEHMIKNGMLCLEDEKQLTREIKHLKIMRVQLASNMSSPDKIQNVLDEKDRIEELLKNLNTELKTLKYKVSKAKVASETIRKKYVEEHEMERELRAQLIAADESCREAKGNLHSLQKQLSDKVVRIMDKWNTSERVMFATQNSNTQDEPSCVFPDDTDENIASNSGHIPDEVKSTSAVTNLETEKTVKSVEGKHADDQVKENVLEAFEKMVNNKEPIEPTEIVDIEEMEKTVKSIEEKHSDDQIKENVLEAHERKKRNAKKAQMQAETRAQKEAQQRENARLKRLRKRERKRAAKDAAARCPLQQLDDGGVARSNKSKEIENTNGKPQQHPPPPHFLPKQLKPKFTPPPLAVAAAIRNRKRWWHWGNMVITVIVLVLSVLSFRSIDFFHPS